jgi:hypothetical protein
MLLDIKTTDGHTLWRYAMKFTRKVNPRHEHRLREKERAEASACLAEKYPQLKSLNVELNYVARKQGGQDRKVKYQANLDNARSVLLFRCAHWECAGGDFDLSRALASAVAGKRTNIAGELECEGWRDPGTGAGKSRCGSILQYKLTLRF